MKLSPEAVIRNAARPVPRYTSYPTAPHFHEGVGRETYRAWLAALPPKAALSLYLHVPFCDTLCWFCGCHTKITRQYAPIAAYLDALIEEIGNVGAAVAKDARVMHIHWGGGSPTILEPGDIGRLVDALRRAFDVDAQAEFAVEVDPRGMDEARIAALCEGGLTRVSVGVQDFDPAVQAKINRAQSVAETKSVVDAFRARGVRSLNIDAIYGLPGQGEAQLMRTLDEVLRLSPDRIALFGYAHVPWMKRHQTRISEAEMPDVVARHAQAEMAAERLVAAGYARIGVDHFALAGDALAEAARAGAVQRNFQGYTVDPADALIGLGASAIGRLPQGYVQNESAIAQYQRKIRGHDFAVVRGLALTDEDRARANVIERLMCDLAFSSDTLQGAAPELASALAASAQEAIQADEDGFVEPTPDGFRVTARGRPFVRAIAARFDAYLPQTHKRHSVAV
jgi:oxygen-independent coproporphyrinogen III oxidase